MTNRLQTIARDHFGWERLCEGQVAAIEAAAAGRDVLGVMPTGYGKSAIYQVTAVLRPGPTVVVSPLIALQRDQVAGLDDAPDAPLAVAVNSAQRAGQTQAAWQAVTREEAEFLFLSPEQLAKDEVRERLAELAPSLVVIDEAHCVSAWGHDFRPDYLRLGEAIQRLGHPPVVALTATAAPPVREDIIGRLGLRDPLVVTRGFDRPNLELRVVRHVAEVDKRRALLERTVELGGSGLVYVARRRDAEEYAAQLAERGLSAAAYHAGLRAADRARVHERFATGAVDVVVATSAFGMGIDKADVRFVLHADPPGSLDSYYQEVGRAGRDGEPAVVELHYRPEDLALRRFFAAGGAGEDDLRAVLTAVRRRRTVSATALREATDLPARRVTAAVNLLEDVGALRRTRRGIVAEGRERPAQVVAAAQEHLAAQRRVEESRVEMMRGYAETLGCRRQFVLGYFGEELPEPCGNCDTCEHGTPAPAEEIPDDEFTLHAEIEHAQWGTGTVMSTEADRFTVFFPEHGYKTLAREIASETDVVTPAG